MALFDPPVPVRKRPLRTYSRRSHSVTSDREQNEPPTKKRRIDAPITPGTPPKQEPEQLPQLPLPQRGSILAFFKPLGPISSSSLSPSREPAISSSDAALPTSTPPSSPPISKPRSRRRLTTRPALNEHPRPVKQSLEEPDVDSGREPETGNDAQTTAEQCTQPNDSALPPTGNNLFDDGGRSVLSALLASALSARSAEAKPDETKRDVARKKRQKKELVQTTLSLSMNPGPGFTICKTCGLLYNHLNEKDRKDHAKWHAGRKRVTSKLDEQDGI